MNRPRWLELAQCSKCAHYSKAPADAFTEYGSCAYRPPATLCKVLGIDMYEVKEVRVHDNWACHSFIAGEADD